MGAGIQNDAKNTVAGAEKRQELSAVLLQSFLILERNARG
jgi:hypothetical protein